MKHLVMTVIAVILLSFPVTAADTAVATEQQTYHVQYCVDGDTFNLQNGDRVRLIGVDTPEIDDKYDRNKRAAKWTGVPLKKIREYSLFAKQTTCEKIQGKNLHLTYDPVNAATQHRDAYDRVLAYVFIDGDEQSLNSWLIAEGYALTYRKFQFEERDRFIVLENEARDEKKGFWQYAKN